MPIITFEDKQGNTRLINAANIDTAVLTKTELSITFSNDTQVIGDDLAGADKRKKILDYIYRMINVIHVE